MLMKSIIIAIGLGGLCMHHAYAQEQADTTLNRTVVVENQYNPEVMDAFKINVLPEVEEPAMPKQHIDYATSLRPFSAWGFTPMRAMTSDEKQQEAPRGYARAAYGTRNNVDARLSYLWDICFVLWDERKNLFFLARCGRLEITFLPYGYFTRL